MDSSSGIILETERLSACFTDLTPIPCKGYNTLCRAKRYGRWWLLKGLKEPFRQEETYKCLLQKEFDILISLQHPNIVQATSLEEVPGSGTCIVMEWIDGVTLSDWKGSESDGESVFVQLLDAVLYIHAKQIVHRDLKPSNVMITYNGCHVKLIDFGLSDSDSYAVLKQPAGTRGYISPEQASTSRADVRNDIYSIGCILEQMQLGKDYIPVINRCKASAARRYRHVSEVKEAFLKCKNGRGKRMGVYLSVAATVLLAVAFLVNVFYNKTEDVNPAVPYIREQADSALPVPVKRNVGQPVGDGRMPNASAGSKTLQSPVYSLVSRGKNLIDKMWVDSGVDTIQRIDLRGEAFYRFVESSNHFILSVFPQTFPDSVMEGEKTHVINELSEYVAETYVKPTLTGLQSSK